MLARPTLWMALALGLASCERSSSLTAASEALPPESSGGAVAPAPAQPAPAPASTPAPAPAAPVSKAAPPPTAAPASPKATDDPRVSRSAGQPGGVVVLWPRVIPSDITDMNRRLVQEIQTHVRVLVQRALPGRPIDVRPEPERVCRRAGCDATSVNVLFTRQGDGCAVVAVITPPGPVETTLVPWAAGVEIRNDQIPFREPPESHVTVRDLARCSELINVMRQNDAAVEAAIRAATPSAGG